MSVASSSEVLHDCRGVFAQTLIELAETDPRVVALVNDSIGSSNLGGFAERFPTRIFNVGIAEQSMVGVAAGLAGAGKIPFVSAAASFLTARATEQIKVDAGYARNNVKLCGQSPGMAYGELGPTHHSVEDVSWLRAIPGLGIIIPADGVETAAALRWMHRHNGPDYIRIPRMKIPFVFQEDYEFTPGKGRIVRDGHDATVITNGVVLHRALDAAARLATTSGFSLRVVSMPQVKPLDEQLVLQSAATTGKIITAEEGQVSGGLGAAVASLLAQRLPTPMRIMGVPDAFAPTGSEEWLLDHYGLTGAGIAAVAAQI